MESKVELFFLHLNDDKRMLALKMREIILSVSPAIKETIKWNQLTFVSGKLNIAFIYTFPQVQYINLGFFKATSLHDPGKLFEGTGAGMRHIKAEKLKDIPSSQIKKWVKESLVMEKIN